MGLESATFIDGLTVTWPTGSETKSQGDDHIRLIKNVLRGTFPFAGKAFYFPKAEATSGTMTLDITDMNNNIAVTTTGGNVAITLPTLASGDAGWNCFIIKVSADANAAIVSPPSSTIKSSVGATNTIRVGILNSPARFYWDGSSWYCFKDGSPVGVTENFDSTTIPWGYLALDGSSYNSTDFAELFAVLASSTLKDKRGRAEFGVDAAGVNMSSAGWGAAATLGTTKASATKTLAIGELPSHNHAVFLNDPGHFHAYSQAFSGGNQKSAGAGTAPFDGLQAANTDTKTTGITVRDTSGGGGTANQTATTGSGTAFSIVPPGIAVNKGIRAC